jgi:hypothetical protein
MPVAGQITAVSCGSLQGIYNPQIRVYYTNAKYGLLCETLTHPARCRTRGRAVARAKIWIKSEEGQLAITRMQAMLAENPQNTLTEGAPS